MSIKVNCVNEKLAKQQLKNAPKELQEYVNALEASDERWKFVNDEALKKIREQAKNISSNPVLADSLPLSEVAELLRWYKQLSPAQRCTVHSPAGSGGSHGIYNQTEEELIEKWRKR